MALKGGKIDKFVELWCLVALRGWEIWVSSTSFQKSNIGWPQQPPTERVSDISENWSFDDLFHKKGLMLIIRVLGVIQQSWSAFFWQNKAVEATEAVEAVEAIEAVLKPENQYWWLISHPGSWIQLYSDVLKKNIFW